MLVFYTEVTILPLAMKQYVQHNPVQLTDSQVISRPNPRADLCGLVGLPVGKSISISRVATAMVVDAFFMDAGHKTWTAP